MSRRFSGGKRKVGKKRARKDYEEEDSEEYDIDAILDTRGKGKNLEYKIKWKGRDEHGNPWDNSWEPVANVSQAAIDAFEKSREHTEDEDEDADEMKERSPPSDRPNESSSPEKSDPDTIDAASQPLRKRKTNKKTSSSNGNVSSNGAPPPKRRGRPKRVVVASSSDEDEEPEKETRDILVIDSSNSPSVETQNKSKKPGRKSPVSVVGRPKKPDISSTDDRPKKKRGRGRPPKQPKAKRTVPKKSVSTSVESMEIDDDEEDDDDKDETYQPSEQSIISIGSDDDEEELPPPRKRRKKSAVEVDDGVEYEVEKIVKVQPAEDGGKEYEVKWKGCSDEENSWVHEKDLNCPKLLQEFNEKARKKKRRLENKSMPPAKKTKTTTRSKKLSDEWLAWGRSTSASVGEVVEQLVSVLSEQELKKMTDKHQVGWGLD